MDITVVMATYNRAAMVRQTLEAMGRVERDGIDVELVVVDNNSDDGTREAVEGLVGALPLRYLFEARPGKNRALNFALEQVEPGDLVVFTDDDVVPARDWFKAILEVSARYPHVSVFGGKIDLVWPSGEMPSWALANKPLQSWAFSRHDLGEKECLYPEGMFPFGPNFWVRREVFAGGRRYDENIGPQPGGKYKMGSETSFLQQLEADGYQRLYAPSVTVGHHVQPSLLEEDNILKRAFRLGAGRAHQKPLDRGDLFERHARVWCWLRRASIARDYCRRALARISFPANKRFERRVEANMWLAFNIESLHIAVAKMAKQSKA